MQFWIWSATKENWEIVKNKNVWATYDRSVSNKVKDGDIFIFYVKGSLCFQGIFQAVGPWYDTNEILWDDEIKENKLKYTHQIKLKPIQLGKADYRDLVPKLKFVEKKDNMQVYVFGTGGGPVNFRRPIKEDDYNLILEEMQKHPTLPGVPPTPPPTPPLVPHHDNIRDMLYEIGKFEDKISEKEYRLDRMLLDVVWKRVVKGNPYIVFEVQIGGNFYQALTKLKHAWDMWNSIPVLVTTEQFEEEAKQLLQGSFHEIEEVTRIINWKKVNELFELMKKISSLKDEMGI